MPGKQARGLCPVCAEPIPPDETECWNCGAFVIDEAVVRLSRAFGLDREKALKLFEAGFRHTKQLKDRDPNRVLETGEVGLLFICTNCGSFVASGDMKCPRCAAEFEPEPAATAPVEEDILDILLCPVCGADNDLGTAECEVCGEALKETEEPEIAPPKAVPAVPPTTEAARIEKALDRVDDFLKEADPPKPAVPKERAPVSVRRTIAVPSPMKSRKRPQQLSRTASAKVRRKASATRLISAETAGSLVVAAAASLLLAGTLGQRLVSAGIATFLVGLIGFVTVEYVRSRGHWPGWLDAGLLAAGVIMGLAVWPVGRAGPGATGAVGVAVAAAVPFAVATRRLLKSPQRILLAIAAGIPLVGQSLATWADSTFTMSVPWFVGILGAMPWPATLAAVELVRRESASILRKQLDRAERDMRSKDYQGSLAKYDRAIATAREGVPGAEIPWYGKGATLILLGRYDEALRAIDKALDINPRNEVAWVNKGNALTKMGRLVDALRCFNAAIKVSPDYEVAWNNKGNALARLGKFEEAGRCYERALQIDASYRGAWVNKGFVLTKLGRFDEAASCADRALVLDSTRRADPI